MAQLSERNQKLADLAITESLLKTWKAMPHDESSWRNLHEFREHCRWAKERFEFIQAELDALLPKKPRPTPPPDTPPVVSHRTGRGRTGNSVQSTYGEKFG